MSGSSPYASYRASLYQQFARIGRAVANDRRLEILDLLSQGEWTVENLASEIGTTLSNISQHLQVLRGAKLVRSRKEGLHVHYSIAGENVAAFWRSLRALAVDLSADTRELIDSFVSGRDRFEPVGHQELLERVRAGDTIVVDVRPRSEFASGHIPGSTSIPLDELADRMCEIPRDRKIVAYCRGPYCLLSVDAVELLRKNGLEARRLVDGFPEWRAAGMPVAHDEKEEP